MHYDSNVRESLLSCNAAAMIWEDCEDSSSPTRIPEHQIPQLKNLNLAQSSDIPASCRDLCSVPGSSSHLCNLAFG